MSEAYAFMAPGVSGETDDFGTALEWLNSERERYPESGAKGAIYIRLDLAANLASEEIQRMSEAMEAKASSPG